MKKSILTIILCFYSLIIIFSLSCNKKDQIIEINFQNSTKDLLFNYLNQQKIIELNSSLFIDTLISKSEWNNISETSLSKDVKLIYVPLTYNRNSNRIGMTFLFDNKKQNIYYSLITEIPKKQSITSNTKNSNLNRPLELNIPLDDISPINVISGFYKNNMNGFTGSLKAFSLTNHFLWEYGYQNGSKYYEKLITHTNVFDQSKISTPKLSSPKISNSVESNTKKSSNCIMWFLVTYYNDGSFDREYLETTCYNDCEQTTIGISEESDVIKSYCSGNGIPGGGVNGNSDPIDEIINNILDKCLKQFLINLQKADRLSNKIGGILTNVFGKNEKITLNFSQDDYLKNKKGEDLYGQSYVDLKGVYQTKLNARLLNRDFSEERQTLTIMHEVLHDYFFYQMREEIKFFLPNQHTYMLNYIYQMASSLEDLYPQLKQNPNLAVALAFNALESSVFRGDTKDLSLIQQTAEGKIPPQLYFDAIKSSNLNDYSTYQALAKLANGAKSDLGTKPCTTTVNIKD